ncbi:MAG TPA: metallophosphoesterase [Polyangiaceae bacterium]|jgi:3',5'-cyclic AMP phosphodiesterase CpdA|nr:metallophosphoesterase [Polyangiaceae bacterium]
MDLTVALVTDIHFGPAALYQGKLRKLSAHAPALLSAFVERMNREVRPDVVVNLGDDLEDESPEADRARYDEVVRILSGLDAKVLHVAGNHDVVHLGSADLLRAWEPSGAGDRDGSGRLYYSRDVGGYHLVVLQTIEEKDRIVRMDPEQLRWLEADLAATSSPTLVFMHHSAADQHLVGNRWFEGRANICLVRERKELRRILEDSGRVLAVLNGHLHWNHVDWIGGIPYVTVQSLIENLDDDAPGRPAAAHAIVRAHPRRIVIEVEGVERARYQVER